MLRPATPLTILLFAAFALLLLSVLSTPIIKAIPLGTHDDFSYGVFGYCEGAKCSPIEIGYDTLFSRSSRETEGYSLPGSTRTTLSAILIVHPVACLLTLVMLGLAIASHFHAPSHSSRYLLAVFIFSIVTFLVCLLAFLIDVLLFVPHMAWGSYIVLAATILDFLSLVISCAMRRTLVGRKARKKRIAGNAEMSGENYYNRQAQEEAATAVSALAPVSVPPMSSHNESPEKPGAFATYDQRSDGRGSEERVPLTQRSTSDRSRTNPVVDQQASGIAYGSPQRTGSANSQPRDQRDQRDQYGNVIYSPEDPYGVRRGPSFERIKARGRGAPMGAPRGRGGYGRGAYAGGMHSTPPPRGGYGPPGRGGPGPRGGYGGPRGGYGAPMRGGRPPPPPSYAGGVQYDRRPPPRNAYGAIGQRSQETYGSDIPENAGVGQLNRSGSVGTDLPRAESPPPLAGEGITKPAAIGQAVEMDATTGSPAHPPQGFGQYHSNGSNTSNTAIRDSDADVAGMLALQQARSDSPRLQPDTYMGGGERLQSDKYAEGERLQPATYSGSAERLQPNTYSGGAYRPQNGPQRTDTYLSETSRYSQEESQYVPVRQAWDPEPSNAMSTNPALNRNYSTATVPSPLDIPSQPKNNGGNGAPKNAANVQSYYEDIDPRFVDAVPRTSPPAQGESTEFDDPHTNAGARSPTTSEHSAFTSISQRGINPRWRPPPGQGYGQHPQQMPPLRKPVNKQENMNILNSNPDFQLPNARGGNTRGAAGGMIPGSAYPGV